MEIMTTETPEKAADDTPLHPALPSVGSWNREEFLARLAEIERRKDDPEYIAYVQRGAEGAAEARRQINEQERRWLDEKEGKVNEVAVTTTTQKTEYDKTLAALPSNTGMTDEQKRIALAAAGRHRNNPDFIESGREQVAEYRRQLQEQLERELADEGE